MRFLLTAIVSLVFTLQAAAQDYYARGTFGATTNPWDDVTHPMIQDSGDPTHYTATVNDPLTLFAYDFKIANLDFSTAYPGSNAHIVPDSFAEMNFHLWTNGGNPWTDGYYPNNTARVGYNDPGQFGWEIVGSLINNWRQAGTDPVYSLTNAGSGVYTTTIPLTAGIQYFKFRQQDSWETAIGDDFGNSSADNTIHVWDNGESWTFTLDLPNGRWRATTTAPNPDPTGEGNVDIADYVTSRKSNDTPAAYAAFRKHFGEVPPPPPAPAFWARGQFNGYDQSIPMTDTGGGVFAATVTGLNTGQEYKFKLANANYTQEAPQGAFRDGKVAADSNGEIHFHLFNQTSWTDGWKPDNQRRAGFDDPLQYGWELMGDFNGFAGGPDWIMNNEGGGLYSVETPTALDAGTYGFKFRKNLNGTGDWGTNIGENFGNDGPNATTGALAAGNYKFELDLRNGRWRVSPVVVLSPSLVPEPASVAMAMLAMAMFSLVRRRERG